ncbi:MAG: DHH family phosphoesterase [Clostridia bacterium]|nr:DHH family phosphoesterase [Clostridia bacterium]
MRIDMQAAAAFLRGADRILILSHAHPDGDTLGSATALAAALQGMGKTAAVQCGDPIPKNFEFLFDGLAQPVFTPETVVAVDVADPKLLGKAFNAEYGGRIALCIDHHASNILYAAQTWIEGESASAAEMVYLLLQALGQEITPQQASRLFVGVTTDTGCLRFSNTTVRTFRIAAELAAAGADTYHIIQTFFETKTKTFAALERLALDGMRLYFHDRCALMCITQEMYRESGSDESETDRLTNLPRQIEGVRVGVTLRELADGEFKASVRTHGEINAAAICKRLGGGGHTGAAGCTLHGTKQQAINALLREVQAELDTDTID